MLYVSAEESLFPGDGLFMHTDALLSSFKFCISVASSPVVPGTGFSVCGRWSAGVFSVSLLASLWSLPTLDLADPMLPQKTSLGPFVH